MKFCNICLGHDLLVPNCKISPQQDSELRTCRTSIVSRPCNLRTFASWVVRAPPLSHLSESWGPTWRHDWGSPLLNIDLDTICRDFAWSPILLGGLGLRNASFTSPTSFWVQLDDCLGMVPRCLRPHRALFGCSGFHFAGLRHSGVQLGAVGFHTPTWADCRWHPAGADCVGCGPGTRSHQANRHSRPRQPCSDLKEVRCRVGHEGLLKSKGGGFGVLGFRSLGP